MSKTKGMSVCVYACVRACVCVRACACVRACELSPFVDIQDKTKCGLIQNRL